jgi:vancomycin resistance protein VanJ
VTTRAVAVSPWRKLLFAALLLELAGVVAFIVALLLGERSRSTLILLYLPRLPLVIGVLGGALLAPLTRRRVPQLLAAHGVLLLIVLFPVMGLSVSLPRSSDHAIHLASYNVFFGKAGRPALLDELTAMPVDLLVAVASFPTLGQKLQERLPDRHVQQVSELVLASKYPIHDVLSPPNFPDGTPAMFARFVVDTPDGPLRIVAVHPFSPRHALFGDHSAGNDIAERDEQIDAAVATAKSDPPPFLVVGDTNLPALSSVARRHFGGLTDAFASSGLGFGYTFPTKHPWMRIDRVLGSEGVRFLDARVSGPGTSDHRAIFVDFELTR